MFVKSQRQGGVLGAEEVVEGRTACQVLRLGQTLYPSMHHGLIVRTRRFLPEHTHTRWQWNFEWTVWSFACTLLAPHAPRAQNTNSVRPPNFQKQPHVLHYMHRDDIKQKNSKKKMKKWGEDFEVWYPHCLAHHLPGAPNTNYLAHLIVSQEAITCNNTRVPLEMRNRKMSKRVCNVAIFAIFVTTPRG